MPNPLFKLEANERKSAIDTLIKESSLTKDYYLMLIVSIVIVTIGLLINNAPIVIGGMLVAPLLYSVLSLAMGVVMADNKIIKRSVFILIKSVVVVVVIALIIALFRLEKEFNTEILSRVSPSLAYFLVAMASGIAASFALAKPGLSEAFPGVAVAVALIPPLGVLGIGISFWKWSIIVGSLELFLLNLLGIVFAGIVVFSMMGFYEERKTAQMKIIEEEQNNT